MARLSFFCRSRGFVINGLNLNFNQDFVPKDISRGIDENLTVGY